MAKSTDKLRRLGELEWMRAEIEARRLARQGLATAVALLTGFMALTALTCGFYLLLVPAVGQAPAALIVGGVLMLISLCIFALAMRGRSREAELEAELLARSIQEARDALRGGGDSDGGSSNLAIIITVLNALSALSPTLAGYIQPILKIIR